MKQKAAPATPSVFTLFTSLAHAEAHAAFYYHTAIIKTSSIWPQILLNITHRTLIFDINVAFYLPQSFPSKSDDNIMFSDVIVCSVEASNGGTVQSEHNGNKHGEPSFVFYKVSDSCDTAARVGACMRWRKADLLSSRRPIKSNCTGGSGACTTTRFIRLKAPRHTRTCICLQEDYNGHKSGWWITREPVYHITSAVIR